jgi:autotransporter-associated beta strand protein
VVETAQTLTLSGMVSDATTAASLTKAGAGKLVLSGTGSYSGATAITNGTLVMGDAAADTFATSGVTVSSGATLGGSGTIAGNLVLNAESALNAKDGGKLAPGNSPGVLTASGTTTVNTGSIFAWTIDTDTGSPGRGTEYAGLNTTSVSGSGAVFQIVTGDSEGFADAFWTSSHNWDNIFKNAGGSANLVNDWSTVFSSFAYSDGANPITNVGTYGSFSWTSSGSTLTWTAVPEPTSALAGLLLAAGLLRRRRGRNVEC